MPKKNSRGWICTVSNRKQGLELLVRWKNLCKELAVAVRCKWRECNEAGEIKKERIGKRNELTGIMNHRAISNADIGWCCQLKDIQQGKMNMVLKGRLWRLYSDALNSVAWQACPCVTCTLAYGCWTVLGLGGEYTSLIEGLYLPLPYSVAIFASRTGWSSRRHRFTTDAYDY